MAKIRRIIRKIQPAPQPMFDEQFWPVIVTLFVLGGLLMGIVAAYLPFRSKHWWHDARFYLFAIPVVTCLAIWLLRYVDRQLVRRTLQVSIGICIIVHVVLLVISIETSALGRLWNDTRQARQRKPRPQLIVADYQSWQLESRERQQQDFVKPLETKVPDPEAQQVDRREAREEPRSSEALRVPTPLVARDTPRSIVERETAVESLPRLNEQPSQLSRQQSAVQPSTPPPVAIPPRAAPERQEPAEQARLEPRAADPERVTSPAPASAVASTQAAAAQPSAGGSGATVASRRQAAEDRSIQETRASPTLPRSVVDPAVVPGAGPRTGESPTVARQGSPPTLEANRTAQQKQGTPAPRVEQDAPLPLTSPSTSLAQSLPRRQQPDGSSPELAQAPTRVPGALPRETSRLEAKTASSRITVNPSPVPDATSAVEAGATRVARTDPVPPAASPANEPRVRVNPPAVSSVVRRAEPASRPPPESTQPSPRLPARRAPAPRTELATEAAAAAPSGPEDVRGAAGLTSGSPTINRRSPTGASHGQPGASVSPTVTALSAGAVRAEQASRSAVPGPAPANRLARAAESLPIATARGAAATPAAVATEAGAERPLASPSRMALTKSLSGVAGVGQSPNLDRAPTTPGSPSLVASGAARRAEPTQTMPRGPALAPSDAPLARRMVAGTNLPGSPVIASTTGVAAIAGDQQRAELASSASASLARNAASAAPGEVTAPSGQIEVDLGPARVADAGGFERAAGGGQPDLNFESDAKHLARTRSGGTAAVDLSVPSVAANLSLPQIAEPGGDLVAAVVAERPANSPPPSNAMGVPQDIPPGGEPERQAPGAGIARADSSANQPAAGRTGDGLAEDDDERRRRRLARVADTASATLALNDPIPIASPLSPSDGGVASLEPRLENSGASGTRRASSEPSVAAPPIAASGPASGGERPAEAAIRRAETSLDAVPGASLASGGNSDRPRSATPTAQTSNAATPLATTADKDQSSGRPAEINPTTTSYEPSRIVDMEGRVASSPVGADAAPTIQDTARTGRTDMLAGSRISRTDTISEGAAAAATPSVRAPLTRSNTASPIRSNLTVATIATATPLAPNKTDSRNPSNTTIATLRDGNPGVHFETPMERKSSGGPAVELAAVDGPGGLGPRVSLDVGIHSRPAQRDSLLVQSTPARFIRQDPGGPPELNTAAVLSAEAFRRRGARTAADQPAGAQGATGPQTEEAIELGLSFLARHQLPDGSWTLRLPQEEVTLASDTAATGLALLAFQGAGYHHRDFRYAAQVAGGLAYLVKNQKANGDLFVPLDDSSNQSVWLYSHGIASIALCEAFGMTQDPQLAVPAQKSIDFIVASQDRKGGGWRYVPGVESDTSVTGWMMMALKSGELAGLRIPPAAYDGIRRWMDASQVTPQQRHLYRYNPYAPNTDSQRHGRLPSPTMTSVGLLMRLYGGWRRDNLHLIQGADYLAGNLPQIGSLRDPKRDTYYWYYATQVMFHMGGEHWEKWHSRLHPLLVDSQIKRGESAGSWSPGSPVPDRWSPHAGRLYVTTLNLLSLEVVYRHLPLYEDTAR